MYRKVSMNAPGEKAVASSPNWASATGSSILNKRQMIQNLFVSFLMACGMLLCLQIVQFMLFSSERNHPDVLPKVEKVTPMAPIRPWRKISTNRTFKEQLVHAFDQVEEKQHTKKDIEELGLAKEEPLVYFITPTYKRTTQMLDMIRLSQTLMLDGNIYWIVVEDASGCTQRIRDLLDRTGLLYAHVAEETPEEIKKMNPGPKGVNQRNRALDIIANVGHDGVAYFGDDDNAYDIRLFDQLRKTKFVSVFGIGFVGGGAYERCVVHGGKTWYLASNWGGGRKFPLDMGAFAIHTKALQEKNPRFRNDWPMGFLETRFLEQLLESISQMEPLNSGCRMILTWHVKTSGGQTGKVYADEKEFDLIKNLV